jgi:outer membrane protein assembly factor BamA
MRLVVARVVAVAAIAVGGTSACTSSHPRTPNVEFACEAERCPLRFEGNAQVSDAELTAEVMLRQPQPGDLFRDLAPVLVRAAYYDRGFVDARVTARTQLAEGGGRVLVIAIDEGRRYWVQRLSVTDPANLPGEPLGNPSALRAAISQPEGGLFARHVMIDEVKGILGRYREMGYAWADADVAVRRDGGEPCVTVDITIDRGPAAIVDRVDVRGGEQLSDRMVQDRLAMHAGDVYRASAVEASFRALSELVGGTGRIDVHEAPVAGRPGRVAVTFGIVR